VDVQKEHGMNTNLRPPLSKEEMKMFLKETRKYIWMGYLLALASFPIIYLGFDLTVKSREQNSAWFYFNFIMLVWITGNAIRMLYYTTSILFGYFVLKAKEDTEE
jgi:hypothetical protein